MLEGGRTSTNRIHGYISNNVTWMGKCILFVDVNGKSIDEHGKIADFIEVYF